MKLPFSLWRQLGLRLSLGLLLLLGLCLLMGAQSHLAHAASTLTVSDCSSDSQLQADVKQANTDNANDTITFSCGGDIQLSSTLTISGSMTLDGSGHSVTLDGQHTMRVLSVNSGVSFILNTLTVANGSASYGGGLETFGGTVSISNSAFSGNSAGIGGGLWNVGGTVSISNSTFSGNSATETGGSGLFTEGGTVSISNSTFSGNSAAQVGGGIYNDGSTVSISNSTFSGNSAAQVGTLYNQVGTVSIGGSIIAANAGGNCFNIYGGSISDQGYNLSSDSSCGFTATGDRQNTDPLLASALASNGGPTQTLALLDGSPAIDQIPAASCPANDQRSFIRLDDNEPTCDIGAYESGARPDSDLGLINMPANITTNATSPQGAVVTYTSPTAVDESGDTTTASVSCTPASGSTFPTGTTTVTCTASDRDDLNSPVSKTFTVTVNDADLALSKMPTDMTVNATSPQGASVTYTPPTVVDEDSPLPTVNCTPASGSVFPIGTTTVTCKVADSDDTPGMVSQSFTVKVNGAATQVSNLINLVNSFHLASGLQKSLDAQLQAMQTDLTNHNTTQACSDLTSFINHVEAQSGKGLTVSQANQLIAAAKQVQAVLGC